MTSRLTIALRNYILETAKPMDYATFSQQVALDEDFLDWLNQAHPLWETDAIEWAVTDEGRSADG